MNPTVEKSATSEFNVSVNVPPKPQGMVKIPDSSTPSIFSTSPTEAKKSGGFFSKLGRSLGIEAAPVTPTPTAEKPKDFTIPDTVKPVNSADVTGIPQAFSEGMQGVSLDPAKPDATSVPQGIERSLEGVNLDPAKTSPDVVPAPGLAQGITSAMESDKPSVAPAEDKKFTLSDDIKPVNEAPTPAASQVVAGEFGLIKRDAPKTFDEGLNLETGEVPPAGVDNTLKAPDVSATIPEVQSVDAVPEAVASIPVGPSANAAPEAAVDASAQHSVDGAGVVVVPETPETETTGPTVPEIEHPASIAPSSLDSSAATVSATSQEPVLPDRVGEPERKDEAEKEAGTEPYANTDVAQEEPLLFAEQGGVESGGVLPGSDSAVPEVEKAPPDQEEKLKITGMAIDTLSVEAAKKEETATTPTSSEAKLPATEDEKKKDSQIRTLLLSSNPAKYIQIKNGEPNLNKALLDDDTRSYLLILADGFPNFRKQLEESGVEYSHLQAVMKNEMKEEAGVV